MIQEKHEIGQIKSETVSVTTTVNGNAQLPGKYFQDVTVLAATVPNSSDTIVIPYRYTNVGSKYAWGVHITESAGSMNPRHGTYDVVIYFIER